MICTILHGFMVLCKCLQSKNFGNNLTLYVRQTILDTTSTTFKTIKKFKKMDVDMFFFDDLHNFACFQTDKSNDIQWEDSYHYLPVIYTGVAPTNYWTN